MAGGSDRAGGSVTSYHSRGSGLGPTGGLLGGRDKGFAGGYAGRQGRLSGVGPQAACSLG
jgi:hypothetical protein